MVNDIAYVYVLKFSILEPGLGVHFNERRDGTENEEGYYVSCMQNDFEFQTKPLLETGARKMHEGEGITWKF
jgi:hypothetical protein